MYSCTRTHMHHATFHFTQNNPCLRLGHPAHSVHMYTLSALLPQWEDEYSIVRNRLPGDLAQQLEALAMGYAKEVDVYEEVAAFDAEEVGARSCGTHVCTCIHMGTDKVRLAPHRRLR